jgi:hypothetical protein
MTLDVDKERIANTTADPEEHDEIEITREMLEAGAEAFLEWQGLEFGTAETAALVIFKAMVCRSPTLRNLLAIEN